MIEDEDKQCGLCQEWVKTKTTYSHGNFGTCTSGDAPFAFAGEEHENNGRYCPYFEERKK